MSITLEWEYLNMEKSAFVIMWVYVKIWQKPRCIKINPLLTGYKAKK